jgi:hypothetical protein
MLKIFGTYARNTLQDTWHWRKECPSYPVSDTIEFMVCTSPLPMTELCPDCLEMDIITAKEISLEAINNKRD